MNNSKKRCTKQGMYIGLGMELVGILGAVILVLTGNYVPGVVTTLLYLGMMITLVSSFLCGRYSDHEAEKASGKKVLPFILALLAVLTVIVSCFSMGYISM